MTLKVDSDAYLAQANLMDSISRSLSNVISAAQSTDVTGGAFGVICSFLVGSTNQAIVAVTDTIQTTAEVTEKTADVLRDIAVDFESTEAEIAADIEALTELLPQVLP